MGLPIIINTKPEHLAACGRLSVISGIADGVISAIIDQGENFPGNIHLVLYCWRIFRMRKIICASRHYIRQEMKKIIFTVHGDVQRIGYRDYVQKIARRHHISGQVRNLDEFDVEIIAQGSEDDLNAFKEDINVQKHPILVESIECKEGEPSGVSSSFKIIRGEPGDELAERMDTAIHYLARIDENSTISARNSEILIQKMDLSLEKQDQMLSKQDQMLDKQDMMLTKQDETIGEIKALREDITVPFDKRFTKLEHEINSIKEALHRAGIQA